MRANRVPPSTASIVEHLAGGRVLPAELRELDAWLAASAPFRSFVDANRDKIRKKLRLATTPDARLDLRAELRVASLLLADRRFALEFEAYGSGNRGPDFTVLFRSGRPFNLEVTRRHAPGATGLERTILGKLRQLPPSTANVLVVAVGGEPVGTGDAAGVAAPDLAAVTRELRARAERRDDAWFAARGVQDAAAFNQGSLRLGAVIVWRTPATGGGPATWTNPGARIGLDPSVVRALETALRG